MDGITVRRLRRTGDALSQGLPCDTDTEATAVKHVKVPRKGTAPRFATAAAAPGVGPVANTAEPADASPVAAPTTTFGRGGPLAEQRKPTQYTGTRLRDCDRRPGAGSEDH